VRRCPSHSITASASQQQNRAPHHTKPARLRRLHGCAKQRAWHDWICARNRCLNVLGLREAAEQAAESRLYGGIHTRLDNSDGLKLDQRIGQHVESITAKLTASASRTKGTWMTVIISAGLECSPKHMVAHLPGVFEGAVSCGANRVLCLLLAAILCASCSVL
jgi:hypothetical protein